MANQWFIARNNKKHGPFTAAKLKELAAQGRLFPTDMLLKEGMQKWVAASSVKGLFSAGAARPVAAEKHHAPSGGGGFQFDTAADSPKMHPPKASSRKKLAILGAVGGSVLLLTLLVVLLVVAFRGRTPTGKEQETRLTDGGKGTLLRFRSVPMQVNDTSVHIMQLAFSPDRRLVASAGIANLSVGRLKAWEAASGKPTLTRLGNVKLTTGGIWGLTFSPNSKYLAFLDGQGGVARLTIWDVDADKEKLTILQCYSPSTLSPGLLCYAFSPDSQYVAVVQIDKTILAGWEGKQYHHNRQLTTRCFDMESGKELWSARGSGTPIAFSDDGQRIVMVSASNVHVADVKTGHIKSSLGKRNLNRDLVAFSPDGKYLATVLGIRHLDEQGLPGEVYKDYGNVELWNLSTNEHDQLPIKKRIHQACLLSFSPDGKCLRAAGRDRAVVWEVKNRTVLYSLEFAQDSRMAAFSDDSILFATSIEDEQQQYYIKSWDLKADKELFSTEGRDFAVTRDCRFLFNGWRNVGTIWDLRTGKELMERQAFNGTVDVATFSADGKRLAIATSSNGHSSVFMWSLQ